MRPRFVVVSPAVPHDGMDSAGGAYLQAVHLALAERGEVTFLCPDVPTNRGSGQRPGAPERLVVLGGGRSLVGRAWQRVLFRAWTRAHRRDDSMPPWGFAWSLLASRSARRALAGADVVDLQWSEMVRLAPLVRRLNRRARVVGTFHDVLSQRYARRRDASPVATRPVWQRNVRIARRSERSATRRLDRLVVLSPKDAGLLPRGPAQVEVVAPPLAVGPVAARHPAAPPRVLFVGNLRRDDNVDAVWWLLREVWPRVRAAFPDAVLRVVGAHAPDALRDAAAALAGVEVAGFVDDLAAEYAAATVAVAPVRSGAGVKFKSIEAIVAGVPLVATTVGAEGVGEPGVDPFSGVADDPGSFADLVVDALLGPGAAAAERAQRWAREVYGRDRFEAAVDRVYC